MAAAPDITVAGRDRVDAPVAGGRVGADAARIEFQQATKPSETTAAAAE